jgi:hypothetical protein
VASVHRAVLMSRFAPVILSSFRAVASEVQPDTSQATATKLIINFMDCSARPRLVDCASRSPNWTQARVR